MHALTLKVMTWSGGLFGAVTFVACVVYGLIVPRAFHAPLVQKSPLGRALLGAGARGTCAPARHGCLALARWIDDATTRFHEMSLWHSACVIRRAAVRVAERFSG